MVVAEGTLLLFLLIMGVGLIIPELFKKRLPLIVIIIILGAMLGPNGVGLIKPDVTLEFFGFLGMTFLMLMAGLETDTTKLKDSKKKIFLMALLNGGIPLISGLLITRFFGYSWQTSMLVGIVFISSSVAVVIPSLRSAGLFKKELGQIILGAVLVADIASLIALSFVLQTTSQSANFPLPIYYLLLFLSIYVLFKLIPKISDYALHKRFKKEEGNERKIRFILLIIISWVVYFTILGVHPILGAFLVGLALSGVMSGTKDERLQAKIHTLGYGLFIPVFFFIIGTDFDLSLFTSFDFSNIVMIALILGSIITKILSGYLAGRIVKFTKKQSWTYGMISVPYLTTALAVTYAAQKIGLFDSTITTSIILIAIISTILGPVTVSAINKR